MRVFKQFRLQVVRVVGPNDVVLDGLFLVPRCLDVLVTTVMR
jgi:hypothetical protein